MRRAVAALMLTLVCAAGVAAHVVVLPRESGAGAEQVYTVRVPTEGTVPTTSIALDIPPGLHVIQVAPGDGYTFDVRREADRIVSITWTREIKPKERAEFAFTAHNPAAGSLQWKAHQHFADGTTRHWVGEPGTKEPASITRIVAKGEAAPPPAGHEAGHQKH